MNRLYLDLLFFFIKNRYANIEQLFEYIQIFKRAILFEYLNI